jgi:hypothetical protein
MWLPIFKSCERNCCRGLSIERKIGDRGGEDGTEIFLKIAGAATRGVRLKNNDCSKARVPCQLGNDLAHGAVKGVGLGAEAR